MLQLQELKTLLSQSKKIVIVPHRNPDGDAIGSTLALYHFFKNEHNVTVISPNKCPDFLSWMPNAQDIVLFDSEEKKAKQLIADADLMFLLDFNALHRTGDDMEFTLKKYKGTFVMIDHHQQPDDLTKFMYSDTSMSSTCQMVYHFIDMLDATNRITKDIATCLYTGILTDTGSFKFPTCTSTTMRVAADLKDKGADSFAINSKVFDTNSYSRLQLLGCALQNMRIEQNLKTAFISLSSEELARYNYKKGDTEGVVNYCLSLKGIVFAAIFIEDAEQKIIKISFRSKGSFSVNEFARAHFNGGGHNNAAGGKSTETLEKTVAKFLDLLPQYKQELVQSYED